jgi:formylglycine-generating enzyme required for sulfatase activity/actin-like ATPase involved in cell morphogenesis
MSHQLGIDLGTTFTSVARARAGSIEVVSLGERQAAPPAMIFVEPDGNLIHGDMAYRRGASQPDRLITDIKRRLGTSMPFAVDGVNLRAETLVAAHLQWAYDQAIAGSGEIPDAVVLTQPACWSDKQLLAFRRAVESTTVPNVSYLTEPHAAGAFYSGQAEHGVGDLIGVYDLGGGTFDAAVLRRTATGYEIVGTPAGESHLGGLDLDLTMQHLVQSKLGAAWTESAGAGGAAFERASLAIQRECTAAKETLSVDQNTVLPLVLPAGNADVEVGRREYEQYIDDAITESVGVFRRVLQSAGVAPSELAAVLMVGGSTAVPLVQQRVAELVGPGVTLFNTDPRNAVAKGAAMTARSLVQPAAVPAAEPVAETPAAPVVEPAAAVAAAPLAAAAAGPEPEPAGFGGTPPPAAFTAEPPKDDDSNVFGMRGVQVLLGVLVLGVLGFLFLRGGDTDDGVETADADAATGSSTTVEPANPSAADVLEEVAVAIPLASADGMVAVPAGDYPVGVAESGRESLSERTVTLAEFHIDDTEVTNAAYLPFVQLEGAPAPSSWNGGQFIDDEAQFPVIGVEWAWASAYCAALGKRLPTEAEWEAAARGAEGAVFPWGTDELLIDFDAKGREPVLTEEYNVSPLGVHDTLGGVWEWVDEPLELTAEASQVVRKGGENGRVDESIGTAIRQVVQQTNQAAVDQTGFRCAADETDPSTPGGQFINDLVAPTELAQIVRGDAVDGAFVEDQFEDINSGWFDVTADGWRIGYHAPTWYHVEATTSNSQVMALGGYSYDNVAVETSVFVESTDTPDGEFRYGLVFRASGGLEAAPTAYGNARPIDFYAFVINPRNGTWQLLHEDELPYRTLAEGPLPSGVSAFDPDRPDTIRAEMVGVTIKLAINGQEITTVDTRGFHPAGDVGFFLETFDETKAHIHYENMLITPLG